MLFRIEELGFFLAGTIVFLLWLLCPVLALRILLLSIADKAAFRIDQRQRKIVIKLPRGLIAVLRLFADSLEDDFVQGRRDAGIALDRRRRLGVHVVQRDGDGSIPLKGQLRRDHFIEHHAQ